MKHSIYLLLFVVPMNVLANQVGADFSKLCQASNGWTVAMDFYDDGHPMGGGDWSGIVQFNQNGKFPITSDDNQVFKGVSHGEDRLTLTEVEYSMRKETLKLRTMSAMGDFSNWSEYSLNCQSISQEKVQPLR